MCQIFGPPCILLSVVTVTLPILPEIIRHCGNTRTRPSCVFLMLVADARVELFVAVMLAGKHDRFHGTYNGASSTVHGCRIHSIACSYQQWSRKRVN